MAEEDVRELLAELDSGETLNNVIVHAIERGRAAGYQKGWQVGWLQGLEEKEWKNSAALQE